MHAMRTSSLASLLVVVGGERRAGWRRAAASRARMTAAAARGVEAAPPTVAEACGQFASALCGRLDGCAPYALQIFYGDSATCMSRVALGCMRDLEVPDSNETTTDMAACARDANNASCDDLIANDFPASCQIKPGVAAERRRLRVELAVHEHALREDRRRLRRVRAARGASGACTVDEGCTQGLVCAAQKCVDAGGDERGLQRHGAVPRQPLLQRDQQHLRDAAAAGRVVRGRHQRRAISGRGCRATSSRGGAEVRDRRRREGRPGVRPRQQHADPLRRAQHLPRASH